MRRRWIVIGIAVLAVLMGIATNMADARLEPYGPTGADGAMGEDVAAFPFTVHVLEVHAAHAVVDCCRFEPPPPTETDGVWVVVSLSYATADQPRTPAGGALVLRSGDGREFPVSLRSSATPWLAGPDIWIRGDLAFEVAPDTLDDLTLVFDPGLQIYGPMPMSYARIPLELGAGGVVDVLELQEQAVLGEGER